MDEMAQAHARDYRDHRELQAAIETLETFLASPPSRCHRSTVEFLRAAVDGLKADCDHIVAVWD